MVDFRCQFEDILLEMDRILRPEGMVIFRDEVDVVNKVMKIAGGMRWDTKMVDHEDGPLVPEKILISVKQYWVASSNSTTSTDQWITESLDSEIIAICQIIFINFFSEP